MIKINVLGTEYQLIESTAENDPILDSYDGYCDDSVKKCVIKKIKPVLDVKADPEAIKKRIIRHELTHAFLSESGLCCDSDWATNEEMVDWIARQFPKMLKAFKEAKAL